MNKKDLNIGLIGCGRIAFEAHLPAYKKYNKKVVGVCDIELDRAIKAAKLYEIPYYYNNYLDLASSAEVELIDVATRPEGKINLIKNLLPFSKPLLVQKPISYNYKEAFEFYKEIRNKGYKIAVNHNARWSPVSRKILEYVKDNKIGDIYSIHHVNRFNEDIEAWYTNLFEYMFLDHGIHYIDLIRWYTKTMPNYISATINFKPDQIASCPLIYNINMLYTESKKLSVSLYFNNAVPVPKSFDCHWYIDGTKASIHSTIDSVSLTNLNGINDVPLTRLEGDWVPEGFLGAYDEFIYAINKNIEAPHSIDDHIKTLYLANLASESAKSKGEWKKVVRYEYEC